MLIKLAYTNMQMINVDWCFSSYSKKNDVDPHPLLEVTACAILAAVEINSLSKYYYM